MNQKILLTISIFLLITQTHGQQRYCPSNMIQLFNGITCQRDEQCQNLANGFFCYQGYCCSLTNSSPSGYGTSCTFDSQCRFSNSQCRGNICYCRSGFNFNGNQCTSVSSNCGQNQVQINGQCWHVAYPGSSCTYDLQCTDLYANRPLTCNRGVCQWTTNATPQCNNYNAPVERINGVVKNCLYQDCSAAYRCEYNSFFNQGQYICCGITYNDDPGTQYGQPKINPGQSRPLECRAINACTYVDYPHCVPSNRYGYNVCCSTRNCQ